MEKLKAIIAEDEEPARKRMLSLLSEFPEVEIVGVAQDGLETLELVEQLQPDVVFLDIEMPGLNGIDVVLNFPSEVKPHVIFTTAYAEYAIKAFEVNAVDYLLKPFSKERLKQAIEKVLKNKKEQTAAPSWHSLAESLSYLRSEKLPVLVGDRYKLIPYEDIYTIEVGQRATHVYTYRGSYRINASIEHLEKRLPSEYFFRANRSALINLKHIQEIVLWFGNRYKVIMNNGRDIIISRERSKLLRKALKL